MSQHGKSSANDDFQKEPKRSGVTRKCCYDQKIIKSRPNERPVVGLQFAKEYIEWFNASMLYRGMKAELFFGGSGGRGRYGRRPRERWIQSTMTEAWWNKIK